MYDPIHRTEIDETQATPQELDGILAHLSIQLASARKNRERAEDALLLWAGLRKWQRVRGDKSGYVTTGTYEEAVEICRQYYAATEAWRTADYREDLRPQRISEYDMPFEGPEATIQRRNEAHEQAEQIRGETFKIHNEFRRRGGWPRYYLVTSSQGHIHSSTDCHTCRPTTRYGWMPEYSGLTEQEAISRLGNYAEALCSVCFPNAPVAGKRQLTKAQAGRLARAEVVE